MNYFLRITCKIWENTPNSWIDFESEESFTIHKSIENEGILYKNGHLLNYVRAPKTLNKVGTQNEISDSRAMPPNSLFLCKILPNKEGFFEIELDETNKEKEYDIYYIPWIISRYVFNLHNEHGYKLQEGDLFKLGKIILKIRQIRLQQDNMVKTTVEVNKEKNNNNNWILKAYKIEDKHDDFTKEHWLRNNSNYSEMWNWNRNCDELWISKLNNNTVNINGSNNIISHTDSAPSNSSKSFEKDKISNKPMCRICLGDEYDIVDPLINPCWCSGTMKYLHWNCLKRLIKSKVQKEIGDTVTVLTFKGWECEICKSLFPENIKLNNKIYTVIDWNRPASNYIILEGIIKETPEYKSVYVINFKDKKPIKIGRASDSDVRFSDISVSRSHAEIKMRNGELFWNDMNSKFGTLVNCGNKWCVLPNKPWSIQKGNIILRFSLKKKWCALISCSKRGKIPYKSYNDFFQATQGSKCQIKDVPNFLWTDTQILSAYEGTTIEEQKCKNIINKKDVATISHSHEDDNISENEITNVNINNQNDSQRVTIDNIVGVNSIAMFNRSSSNNNSQIINDHTAEQG